MKPDRQPRGQRLPTVPETTSLLGKPGADATSARAFAARSPPQPRRLLPYVAACMALGLLALYFLGALPVGSSSGAWIRSLPQKRHNPAATTPELPQPTDAQLDAAASQLEGGASQSGKQLSGDAGSGSVKLDSSGPGSMGGIGGGSPASSGGDVSSNPAPDTADGDPQQPVKPDETAAQDADLHASVPALAPAPNVEAAAAKEESSDERLQAAADSPAEQNRDAAESGGSASAPQANQNDQAADSTNLRSEAPESSGGVDSDAEGRGSADVDSSEESTPGAPGSNAEGPLASGDGTGKQAAAPEQMPPKDSSAEATSSSAAGPADSVESTATGSRSGDSSQDADAGSLSRASAPDEAALLADPIAKEAQPDSVANSSDASGAASSSDAQSPGAADGDGAADGGAAAEPVAAAQQDLDTPDSSSVGAAAGGDAVVEAPAKMQARDGSSSSGSSAAASSAKSQGAAAQNPGEPAVKVKAEDSVTAPAPASATSASSGSKKASSSKGSKGSSVSKPGSSSKGSKGGSGGKKASSGKGSTGSKGSSGKGISNGGDSKAKGKGPAKPAGRKAAAGQRGSSGSERVTLATQAGDQGSGATTEAGSLAFAPAGCQLIPGQKAPLQWPKCASPPGHIIPGGPDCSFNLTEELQPCPIIGGGLYFEHQKPQPARDVPPFWQERGSGSPSCKSDGVCCSGDGINGTWHDTDAAQAYGALEFRLDESVGCRFHQYTRRQVLSCLANTTVLFWGDSMVRQTFNRIPALFRGHRRVFDAQTWRAERFEVCEAADLRTHAPAFEGLAPRDNHYRLYGLAELTDQPHPFLSLEQVPEAELLDLLDPRAQPKAFPGETCGDTRPVSFQYVPATALWEQYRFGGYYLKTHQDVSQSIWVSQVGYWDLKSREADANYLKTMQEALDRGIQKLVIITVPTAYVGIDERDPRRWILRDRNDFLRRWAANDTSARTVILDMDTLSLAPNAPSGLLGNWTDWHYSCKFSWVDEHEGRNLTAEQWAPHSRSWLDPSGWSLGGLQPNLRRDCVDDMNLTVLQILFNMLCNKK